MLERRDWSFTHFMVSREDPINALEAPPPSERDMLRGEPTALTALRASTYSLHDQAPTDQQQEHKQRQCDLGYRDRVVEGHTGACRTLRARHIESERIQRL